MSPSQPFFIKNLTKFILTLYYMFLPPIIREIILLGLISISSFKYIILIQYINPPLLIYNISLLYMYDTPIFFILFNLYLIPIILGYTFIIKYFSKKYIYHRIPQHIIKRV